MKGSSGLGALGRAGGRSAAVRDGLVLAGAGLVPATFAVVLGLRAVQNEEAAVRREATRETESAARLAEASVEAEVREAEGRLGALGVAELQGALDDRRALARRLAPVWAEPLVLDARLEAVVPDTAPPRSTDPSPRSELACRAAADALRRGEGAPRDQLVGCEAARTELGRWLVPIALLDVLRERADDEAADLLVEWLTSRASGMARAELAATREEIAASTMTPDQRARALAASGRSEPSSSFVAAALRGDAARRALARGADARGLARWRGEGSLGVVRLAPEGGAVGFLVDAPALARAAAARPTSSSTRLRAVGKEPASTGEPRAVVWLAPGLGLEATLAAGDALAARTRRSRWGLWAIAVASASVALGFAWIVFARLRAARRTSELRTSFAAAVSHELRTPLASIRMLAELLEDDRGGDDAERRETAAAIARESRRLGETVSRLLAWSRMREGDATVTRTVAELSEVVGDAVDVFAERNPGVEIERSFEAPIAIAVDGPLVQLAVMNLLENAKKYAGTARRVVVAATEEGARIEVEDDGPGVPRALREKIFEAFERGDDRLSRATEGTGIGLALVRAVARAHGGDATVRSGGQGGQGGAIFRVDLRRARSGEEAR